MPDPEPAQPVPADETNWSAIERGDLDYVVRRYWRPVYAFLRPRLRNADEAEEATQEFFFQFIRRDVIGRLDRSKGRARSLIFHMVRQFLVDRYRASDSAKRRGEAGAGGSDTLKEVPAGWGDPEEEFDREWFLTLCDEARRSVKAVFASRDLLLAYQAFRLFYYGRTAGTERPTQASVAEQLGVPVTQVKNYLHRGRLVYAEALRSLVADSCRPDELQDELRALRRFLDGPALQGPPPSTLTLP